MVENHIVVRSLLAVVGVSLLLAVAVAGSVSAGSTASDDYPANITTSGSVAAGGSATGALESAGDQDWFSVSLAADKTYQIDLKGASSSSGTLPDPYLLGIHDALGDKVASTADDDGGLLFNSRVRFVPTQTGTYYVNVGSFWESTTGTYELSVADVTGEPLPAAPADDYAANTSTSGTVKAGGPAFGELEVFEDRDWFAVELVTGKTYQFDLQGSITGDGTLTDPFLRGIRDSSGQSIPRTANDDGVGLNSRVTYTAADSGTHYVVVGTFWKYLTGTYKLSVADIVRVDTPATGAPTIIGTAQVGQTLTASVSGIADIDGLNSVSYNYQWLADDTEIVGATSSSYTVQLSDVGEAVKVQVTFTDDEGNNESLTSEGTSAVVAGGL